MSHRILALIVLAAGLLLMSSCDRSAPDQTVEQTPQLADTLPEWAKDAVIYEVNVRQYTPEGTFNAFGGHLDRLKDLGVDILWFMPIHPISKVKRKGGLGSYYSVADYRKVNPDFGSEDDFRKLVRDAHSRGMRVILDWVPNHTGWDHPWITSNPGFYTRDPKTDTIIHPEGTDWYDVADLNYDNDSLRTAMIADMKLWVEEYGVDGFRCDVAGKVPEDFWAEAVSALLSVRSDLFMLAESEDPWARNRQFFHADYGWTFKDLCNGLAQGNKTIEDLRAYLKKDSETFTSGAHMYFTTNHDENSWHGTEFERLGEGWDAFFVLASTLPGIPLVYSGQEEPLQRRLAFFEKDDIGFGTYANAGFYKAMNDLRSRNKAIWNPPYGGDMVQLDPGNPNTFAFRREKDGDRVLVFLNLSADQQDLRVTVGDWAGEYQDVFRGKSMTIADPVTIQMPAWSYLVLSNR